MVGEIASYVTAAAGAAESPYWPGPRRTATATVALGRRLAQRIFGVRAEGEELPEALAGCRGGTTRPGHGGRSAQGHPQGTSRGRGTCRGRPRLPCSARRPAPYAPVTDRRSSSAGVIGGDSIQIGYVGGDARIGSTDRD